MSTVRAYVALGANIGAPVQHLRAAVVDLAALPGTRVVARSSLPGSAPAIARTSSSVGMPRSVGRTPDSVRRRR